MEARSLASICTFESHNISSRNELDTVTLPFFLTVQTGPGGQATSWAHTASKRPMPSPRTHCPPT